MADPPMQVSAVVAKVPRDLFGHKVIRPLGLGTRCIVYAVRSPKDNAILALKHIVCTTSSDHRLVEQLQTEHALGQEVSPPGLRRSLVLFASRTWLHRIKEAALTMELVEAQPLDACPPLTIPDILDCFLRITRALRSLHSLGFLHCDITPNNILRNETGHITVIDLGQACRIGRKKERIQGTPSFMAPEQVRCDRLTPRTDIYGLGATFYRILTGRLLPPMFIGGGRDDVLPQPNIAPPHTLKAGIPPTLSKLVMDCIQFAPLARPADMPELIHRLELVQFSISPDTLAK